MKRFDFFQHIHNQIRAQLYETGARLQQEDFDEAVESDVTRKRLQAVLNLLQTYLAFGELHILPAVVACEPAIADSLVQERKELRRLLQMLAVGSDAEGGSAQEPGRFEETEDLTTGFELLALQTIQYLRREENLAGKILWRYYSDEELQALATLLSKEVRFTALPVPAKTEAFKEAKGEEKQFANETFQQSITARAASFVNPQQRSLLQDVLAGGMVV